MRAGSLRAREGGCGAGCAHLGLDLDHLARRETTNRKKEVGPSVRGQSGGSDPADRCTWVGAGAEQAIAPAPGMVRERNGR